MEIVLLNNQASWQMILKLSDDDCYSKFIRLQELLEEKKISVQTGSTPFNWFKDGHMY